MSLKAARSIQLPAQRSALQCSWAATWSAPVGARFGQQQAAHLLAHRQAGRWAQGAPWPAKASTSAALPAGAPARARRWASPNRAWRAPTLQPASASPPRLGRRRRVMQQGWLRARQTLHQGWVQRRAFRTKTPRPWLIAYTSIATGRGQQQGGGMLPACAGLRGRFLWRLRAPAQRSAGKAHRTHALLACGAKLDPAGHPGNERAGARSSAVMHGQLRLAQRMLAQHIAGQRAAGFAIQRQAGHVQRPDGELIAVFCRGRRRAGAAVARFAKVGARVLHGPGRQACRRWRLRGSSRTLAGRLTTCSATSRCRWARPGRTVMAKLRV